MQPADPLTAALNIGHSLIERLFPDPAQAAEAKLKLLEVAQSGELGQIEVNKIEAANPNWWVSGWRPFIGWICGVGLLYQFLFYPLFAKVLPLTPLDAASLTSVLMGMLGLSGMRMFEKIQGVAAK
jgi:hypothetical protein